MATCKTLCMVALLVFSIFVVGANAANIDYGAMHKGDSPRCTQGAKGCLPPKNGPYNRGCEKEEECRGGSRKM